jgi:DNA-binding NarL/FixJ family response regulator
MTIRILLAGLPRIMREIVERALRDAPDMEVIGALDALDALDARLGALEPDVLVVGLGAEGDAPRLDPLLYRMPRLTCLASAGDARRAFLYELHPRATPVRDVSPDGLVQAIRSIQQVGAR